MVLISLKLISHGEISRKRGSMRPTRVKAFPEEGYCLAPYAWAYMVRVPGKRVQSGEIAW